MVLRRVPTFPSPPPDHFYLEKIKMKTVEERIEMFCQSQCKSGKPCPDDCPLLDEKRSPLSRLGRYCMACPEINSLSGCKKWTCHLRPFAPRKSRRRLEREYKNLVGV